MAIDRILERLDSLIKMGERVLASYDSHSYSVDVALAQQWRTSSLIFLSATLGSENVHYREFDERCKWHQRYEAERGLAILRAVREAIAGGYLQKVETLVSASVFSDFLEMAEHLLNNDYRDPAASLVGAVLENGLRRICVASSIPVKPDDNISSLNQKLTQKQVYTLLQRKQIDVWNKLRDYADHGHFDQYRPDDVLDMLKGVRGFLSGHMK